MKVARGYICGQFTLKYHKNSNAYNKIEHEVHIKSATRTQTRLIMYVLLRTLEIIEHGLVENDIPGHVLCWRLAVVKLTANTIRSRVPTERVGVGGGAWRQGGPTDRLIFLCRMTHFSVEHGITEAYLLPKICLIKKNTNVLRRIMPTLLIICL